MANKTPKKSKRGLKALVVRLAGARQHVSICKTVDIPLSGTDRRLSEPFATASTAEHADRATAACAHGTGWASQSHCDHALHRRQSSCETVSGGTDLIAGAVLYDSSHRPVTGRWSSVLLHDTTTNLLLGQWTSTPVPPSNGRRWN